eukprot:TRINITY_DN148_c0_g1_i2.p1 TRINITY_DN148_c0_g1~~TRINITY_DN148_c0_g1_i2.p1  ORF type:complete len:427 (+),score=62.98 TRINITY_DN148_c0_g1_i2:327-1607(+)
MASWTPLRLAGKSPLPRWGHAVVVLGKSSALVYGGMGPLNQFDSLGDVFQMETAGLGSWSVRPVTGVVPSPRSGHTATLVGTRLFVLGGASLTGPVNDVCVLNTNSFSWSRPRLTNPTSFTARCEHTTVAVRNNLYILGGEHVAEAFLGVTILNCDTLSFSVPTTTGTRPPTRCGHWSVALGDRVIVFGGHNGREALGDLHVLDTKTMAWMQPHVKGSLPPPCTHATACVFGSKVVMFGGHVGEISVNHIFELNTETWTWTQFAYKGMPEAREGHAAVMMGTRLLIVGGKTAQDETLKTLYALDLAKAAGTVVQPASPHRTASSSGPSAPAVDTQDLMKRQGSGSSSPGTPKVFGVVPTTSSRTWSTQKAALGTESPGSGPQRWAKETPHPIGAKEEEYRVISTRKRLEEATKRPESAEGINEKAV